MAGEASYRNARRAGMRESQPLRSMTRISTYMTENFTSDEFKQYCDVIITK